MSDQAHDEVAETPDITADPATTDKKPAAVILPSGERKEFDSWEDVRRFADTQNFDTMLQAAKHGNLALLTMGKLRRTIEAGTHVSVMCMVSEVEELDESTGELREMVQMTPVAIMLPGDPYVMLEPPEDHTDCACTEEEPCGSD